MNPLSSSAFCRRATAVLDSPARDASSTWLARAFAVSSARIMVSILSISIGFESCAICANRVEFLH
jgi:hypothetical protein